MSTCSMRRSNMAAVNRCAKTHGNRAAGREFDVRLYQRPTSVFGDVRKSLEALPHQSKTPQRGKATAFPQLERQLDE